MRSSDNSALLANILDLTRSTIIVFNGQGAVEHVNSDALAMFPELGEERGAQLLRENFLSHPTMQPLLPPEDPISRSLAGETLDEVVFGLAEKQEADASPLRHAGRFVRLSSNRLDDPETGSFIVVTLRDVTDDLPLEQFQALFEAAPDATIIVDVEGIILRANQQTSKLFGYEPSEFVGQSVETLMPERFRSRHAGHRQTFQKAMRARPMGTDLELFGLRKTGEEFPIEISLSPIAFDDGSVVCASIRDISEMRQAQDQLIRAQRLDALGQLTGGIAHDFNNLLSTTLGAVQLAQRKYDPAGIDNTFATALKSIRRAGEQTRRLLSFARKTGAATTTIDVGRVIEDVVELAMSTIDPRITIDVNAMSLENLHVNCDPVQFESAMLNLVLNARDAIMLSGVGGNVTISTRLTTTLPDEHGPSGNEPQKVVVIAVTDDGPGMIEAVKKSAMEPFFSTKESDSGAGLGLAMVYGFVKQSGGDVRIYSDEGLGTTVRIILPEAAGEPDRPEAVQHTPQVDGTGKTVLLVDDEKDLVDLTSEVLRQFGFDVLTAPAASPAIEFLESTEPIDVLLTDIVMPGTMHGVELGRVARRLRPGIPVVYMSGFAGTALGNLKNVDGPFIQKPCSIESLSDAIGKALERQRH